MLRWHHGCSGIRTTWVCSFKDILQLFKKKKKKCVCTFTALNIDLTLTPIPDSKWPDGHFTSDLFPDHDPAVLISSITMMDFCHLEIGAGFRRERDVMMDVSSSFSNRFSSEQWSVFGLNTIHRPTHEGAVCAHSETWQQLYGSVLKTNLQLGSHLETGTLGMWCHYFNHQFFFYVTS